MVHASMLQLNNLPSKAAQRAGQAAAGAACLAGCSGGGGGAAAILLPLLLQGLDLLFLQPARGPPIAILEVLHRHLQARHNTLVGEGRCTTLHKRVHRCFSSILSPHSCYRMARHACTGAGGSALRRATPLTQNCVCSSHVAAMSTYAALPCPRFCSTRKWRHPNVRSMAVHLLPAAQWQGLGAAPIRRGAPGSPTPPPLVHRPRQLR